MKPNDNQLRQEPMPPSPATLTPASNRPGERSADRRAPFIPRAIFLFLALLAGLGLIVTTTRLASTASPLAQSDPTLKFDTLLLDALGQADDGRQLRVILHMQPVESDQFAGLPQDQTQRRFAVVQRLQQTSANALSSLQHLLQQYSAEDRITYYRPLWIINGLQVTGDATAIMALASRPEVARVELDAPIQLLDPITATASLKYSILDEVVHLNDFADNEDAGAQSLPWHLQRVRAQHAWAGLGISGTGTTIAVMDTGADWQHPALVDTYHGRQAGGAVDHAAGWFDAVDGAVEPSDPHGHGTHVIGTASGRSGIGVAPGSRWMAVRILGADGFGYPGDIHAGFQWILAPNGDPSRAPDIVNGSWSGQSGSEQFRPDIVALQAAGIIPVFSAGNTGPAEGTVNSPADLPGALAVGATDDIDAVTWFSSRGPSLWQEELKPTIVAPGMQILSALPGGAYGFLNGTSMSAPNVAGILALILSAGAGAEPGQATYVLTSTAKPIGRSVPNHDTGWGRADAYAAIASVVETGHLSGHLLGQSSPLSGAAITITTPSGVDLDFTSSDDGAFALELVPGAYSLTVSHFGYQSYQDPELVLAAGQFLTRTISLSRLPYGTVIGRLVNVDSGAPVSGVVRITGTPVAVMVGDDGRYSVELPVGEYELVAWANEHRLGRRQVAVTDGEASNHVLPLKSGPNVLLVDSGKWYGFSQLEPYARALEANDYAYTTLTIRDYYEHVPSTDFLSRFDAVVWSAPKDSPGLIYADRPLGEYLDAGGNLLIAGHSVAAIASVPYITELWWDVHLQGRFLGKTDPPFELLGEPGTVFEDDSLYLNDLDATGQPVKPDASAPRPGSLTEVGFRYPGGQAASLLADQCRPYHLAYFGFGLEVIAGEIQRTDLMSSTFAYFAQPEVEVGLSFEQTRVEALVPPGAQRLYQIELLNLSEMYTDTFTLKLADAAWPARLITGTVELGPCKSGATWLVVDIPADLPIDTVEVFELVATSTNRPEYEQRLAFHLKTPGRILLVDDDRWYDQASTFKAAMTGAGLTFDFWENPTNGIDAGSPPADLVAAYDFIFWYTGYDWYRPVTKAERESLLAYLSQGGRLFLTSQDYMYYHAGDRLTREYLGVIHYAESVTPTVAYGGAAPFDTLAGPSPLRFGPYQNHGDGLAPAPGARVSLWHDKGYPAGVANAGPDWRTVFWAIPLETLPVDLHALSMNQIVGWLSDLGDSTFIASDRTAAPGAMQTYTLTLRYASAGPGSMVAVTNTLPMTLHVDPATLSGGAYDQAARQITWKGYLSPGQEHDITYDAFLPPTAAPGTRVDNPVQLYYQDHDLSFSLIARSWIDAPDLSRSVLRIRPAVVQPGDQVTVELQLVNAGNTTGNISFTLPLPEPLTPQSGTLVATDREVVLSDETLTWQGVLEPRARLWATFVVTTPMFATPAWLPVSAIIDDGQTQPVMVSSLLELRPHMSHLPLIFRESP